MKVVGPSGEPMRPQDVSGLPVVPAGADISTAAYPPPPRIEEGKVDLPPEASASPDKPEGRPSLDVAIETHGNLLKRVEALCARLASWKLPEGSDALHIQASGLMTVFRAVGSALSDLKACGFVVKVTPRTRLEACLRLGLPVRLRDEKRPVWNKIYKDDEMDKVTIIGNDEAAGLVFASFGSRENSLPVPLKLSDLEPA